MKTSVIEVIYEPQNKIYVKIDNKKTLLLSDDKKQINATEIYKCLNYKKDKKYLLNDLKEYKDINDDYNNYLNEIQEIFKTIIKNI